MWMYNVAVQMGGDRELLFRLLCSPHGLAVLAAGHSAHVNTTNLRLALMDRCAQISAYWLSP